MAKGSESTKNCSNIGKFKHLKSCHTQMYLNLQL